METIQLKNVKDDSIAEFPCQYLQINKDQQVCCIGLPDNLKPLSEDHVEIDDEDGACEVMPLGKLLDQGAIFRIQLQNSLNNYEWDWCSHPNPDIVLITKK